MYSKSRITIAAIDSNEGFISDKRRKIKVKRFKCPGPGGSKTLRYGYEGKGMVPNIHLATTVGPARCAALYRSVAGYSRRVS
jgi:hypothetical protein